MGEKEKKEREKKEKEEREKKEKEERERKEKEAADAWAKIPETAKRRMAMQEEDDEDYPEPMVFELKDPHDRRPVYRSRTLIIKDIDPEFNTRPPAQGEFFLKSPGSKDHPRLLGQGPSS